MSKIKIGLPSKGRIQEDMNNFLASAGIEIKKEGGKRTYVGSFRNFEGFELRFLSANEIAKELNNGNLHLGLTGLDLIKELDTKNKGNVISLLELGFSRADVITAVPKSWIDVSTMRDLADVSRDFVRLHDRRLRVATKFQNLTRNFFIKNNLNNFRIVESIGSTEGSPSAGTAEIITDITSSGKTLEENNLKILDDGIILKSEACIFASINKNWREIAFENIKKFLMVLSAKSIAISHKELTFNCHKKIDNLELNIFREYQGFFLNNFFESGDNLSLIVPNDNSSSCSEYLISLGYGPIKLNKPEFIYQNNNEAWKRLASAIL
tara:strand:+ start:637 stop:1608 length:972 start_codon:yes stop_codon:yes gene_type:complete